MGFHTQQYDIDKWPIQDWLLDIRQFILTLY